MSNLLVLAVCNEPRVLMLGRLILEYIQKGILECIVGVLCRNLVEGWFYAHPSSTTAEVDLWVVGCGGVKYCWNRFRYHFSLPHSS
jgi:hypothetical protein